MPIHCNVGTTASCLLFQSFFSHRYIISMSVCNKYMIAPDHELFLSRKTGKKVIISTHHMYRAVRNCRNIISSPSTSPRCINISSGCSFSITRSKFLCVPCVSLMISIFIFSYPNYSSVCFFCLFLLNSISVPGFYGFFSILPLCDSVRSSFPAIVPHWYIRIPEERRSDHSRIHSSPAILCPIIPFPSFL